MAIKETVFALDLTKEGRHPVVKFRLNDNKVQKITFRLTNNGREIDLEREMGDQFKPVFECIFRDKTFKRDEEQGNWEIKRDTTGKYPLYTFTYYLTDEVINKSGMACYYFALETPEGLRISTPTLKMVIDCDFKEDGKPSENYVSDFEKLLKEAESVKQRINDLDQTLQEVLESGESITEVIVAREDKSGEKYKNLKERLDTENTRLDKELRTNANQIGILSENVNVISFNVDKNLIVNGDITNALNDAINKVNSKGGGTVIMPPGSFSLSSTIYKPQKVTIKGTGALNTILNFTGSGIAIVYDPGSYKASGGGLVGFSIKGNPGSEAGVEISDTYGFVLTDVQIDNFTNGVGLRLHNKNAWTEGTLLDQVRINNNKVGIQFRRTTGTESFGYTKFYNVIITTVNNGIAIEVGDSESGDKLCYIYNSVLNTVISLKTGAVGIKFGLNGWIRASNGLLASESLDNTAKPMETLGGGFSQFTGTFKSSPSIETASSRFTDLRFRQIRELGSTLDKAKWYKVARIQNTPDKEKSYSQISGKVSAQANWGFSSFRSGIINFTFGSRGSAFKPSLTVMGDAMNGISDDYLKFRIYKDADGYHYLYFYQSKYSRYCTFEYTQDSCEEYWAEEDPTTNTGMTLVWDSDKVTDSKMQQMYVGKGKILHSENTRGGTFTTTAAVGQTTVVIPHGLDTSVVTKFFSVIPSNPASGNAEISYVQSGSVNLTVYLKNPIKAETTLSYTWIATV